MGPETFCPVVLGVDALLGLCLQFPIRWGRLNTFSQLHHIAFCHNEKDISAHREVTTSYLILSERFHSLCSTVTPEVWRIPVKEKSSLVYRLPQKCWIAAPTMSIKLQFPEEQVRKLDENKNIKIC